MSENNPPAPDFTLYNTLTRQAEVLTPEISGHLRFYSCGPTVYSYAHIGNFRSFISADLIMRTAKSLGWKVSYVTNITDVGHLTDDDMADISGEDRMAKALASKEGKKFANVWDLADHYTKELIADWQALNLQEPTVRPRATQHMREQIVAIEQLIEKGHAYETDDAVYFAVNSVSDYGKLSGNRDAASLVEATRDVVVDSAKKDPRDFALWKKDDKHLMQWYSPWGWGFPGWHLECSVMATQYLGETFDLHAGGEDLIFPHHECELAQTEGISGKLMAPMWVHTRFLQVEGEKMSKSKGNFFTVRQMISPESEGGRNVNPLALRLALLSGQYRKPINFTLKNLKDSAKLVQRLQETYETVKLSIKSGAEGDDYLGDRLKASSNNMLQAMCDDLNTPKAIAAVNAGVKMISGMKNMNQATAESAKVWFEKTNALLGIVWHEIESEAPVESDDDPFALEVEALLKERIEVRAAKNWARADEIRDTLTEMGVEVMDSTEGTTWRKKM